MRTGEGFLLVYSITSRQSFDEILVFQQQILRVKDKDYFPIIVVGNKCDLENERQVSKQGMFLPSSFLPRIALRRGFGFLQLHLIEYVANPSPSSNPTEGEALARSFGCKFIETSAKSRINVDNAFYDIVREIRRYNKEMAGYTAGGGSGSGSGGPGQKMEVSEGEKERGCCGGCLIM